MEKEDVLFEATQWEVLIDSLLPYQTDLPEQLFQGLLEHIAARALAAWETSDGLAQLRLSFLLAEMLKATGDLQGALHYYLTALEAYELNGMSYTLSHSQLLLKIAAIEIELAQYSTALGRLEKVSQPGVSAFTQAWALELYGEYYRATANYYEALDYFNRALEVKRSLKPGNDLLMAKSHEQLGLTYHQLAAYKKAEYHFKNALRIKKKLLSASDARLSANYVYLANTLFKQLDLSDHDRREHPKPLAFIYADSALNGRSLALQNNLYSLLLSDFPSLQFVPVTFSKKDLEIDLLATLLGEQSQYSEDNLLAAQLDRYQLLIEETSRILSVRHPTIIEYKLGIMTTQKLYYRVISQFWDHTNKGLTGLYRKFVSDDEPRLKGELYLENFRHVATYMEKALDQFESVVSLTKLCYGQRHPKTARQYVELSKYYHAVLPIYYHFVESQNDQLKALEKLIDDPEQAGSEEAERAKEVYSALADSLFQYYNEIVAMEKKRIKYANQSIQANLYEPFQLDTDLNTFIDRMETTPLQSFLFAPELMRLTLLNNSQYQMPYIGALMPALPGIDDFGMEDWMMLHQDELSLGEARRSDLKIGRFQLDQLRELEKEKDQMMQYDRYVDLMMLSLLHDEDKFSLAGKTRKDRLSAIYVQTNQDRRIKGVQPLEEIFYFAEKTKSLGLMHDLNRENTLGSVGLPPHQVALKKELQSNIRLTALAYAKTRETSALEQLASQKQQWQQLENEMIQSSTKYARSRINKTFVSIETLRKFLPKSTALISYSFTDRFLFRITITKEDRPIYEHIKMDPQKLNKQIKGLRNSIIYRQDESFANIAHHLGDRLLPRLSKEIDRLIIIPDGELNMLPFEALLTEKVKNKTIGSYAEYPFLIRQYQVSYGITATLTAENLMQQRVTSGSVMALAPVFADAPTPVNDQVDLYRQLDSLQNRGLLNDGKYVAPLPGTEIEVTRIARLFRESGHQATLLLHDQAREEALKQLDMGQYQYLHIATHGIVNLQNPQLSGLILSQRSGEDGILYTNEIYALDLPMELITLSACETGLGRIVAGEGSIGLVRAFQYTGAKNLIISYWKVSDTSTTELMIDLYTHLLENPSWNYGKALRAAKLRQIQSATFAHPYYWSPFILMGN